MARQYDRLYTPPYTETMSRTAFAALLKKYQTGHATEAERRVVEQWYALLDEEPRPLGVQERQDIEERLWRALQQNALRREAPAAKQLTPVWRRGFFQAGVAAVLTLALAFLIYQSENSAIEVVEPIARQKADPIRVVTNHTNHEMPVVLEDGSKALLSSQSELRFPAHFTADKREVFLGGEAFFEVSENPERPFLVNAGQITTKVLGTSFLVKAPPGQLSVEVEVKTGKVSVYERDEEIAGKSSKKGSGVVLAANHRVTFSGKDKLFLTSLVENPVPLPETRTSNRFDFDDTPLVEVVHRLEEAYRIKIEMEKKTLGVCPFTARLSDLDLYEQLDIICATIQGEYDIKGTTILISGKGCDSGF